MTILLFCFPHFSSFRFANCPNYQFFPESISHLWSYWFVYFLIHVFSRFLSLRHGWPSSSCESHTKTIQQWQRRRQNERVRLFIYLILSAMTLSHPTMASLISLNHFTSHQIITHHIAPPCIISYLIFSTLSSLHSIASHTSLCYTSSCTPLPLPSLATSDPVLT